MALGSIVAVVVVAMYRSWSRRHARRDSKLVDSVDEFTCVPVYSHAVLYR